MHLLLQHEFDPSSTASSKVGNAIGRFGTPVSQSGAVARLGGNSGGFAFETDGIAGEAGFPRRVIRFKTAAAEHSECRGVSYVIDQLGTVAVPRGQLIQRDAMNWSTSSLGTSLPIEKSVLLEQFVEMVGSQMRPELHKRGVRPRSQELPKPASELAEFAESILRLRGATLVLARKILARASAVSTRSTGVLHCSWTDGGTLIAEWIKPRKRVGFSFDSDIHESSWFVVDFTVQPPLQQSGSLESADVEALVRKAVA